MADSAGAGADLDNLRYGRETEPFARDEYSCLKDTPVIEAGLTSKEFPWLSASPDGLVIQDDGSVLVLEIKCPVSEQDGKIDVDWTIEGKLKKSHSYYAQVQVQMFCCDVKLCHLYVYGTQDSKNIPVGKKW